MGASKYFSVNKKYIVNVKSLNVYKVYIAENYLINVLL